MDKAKEQAEAKFAHLFEKRLSKSKYPPKAQVFLRRMVFPIH